MLRIIFIFLGLFLPAFSYCKQPALVLEENTKSVQLSGLKHFYYEDSSSEKDLEWMILHPEVWKNSAKKYYENPNINYAYWFKLDISNISKNKLWYLVSHNYAIKEIDAYLADNQGQIQNYHFDSKLSLSHRKIQHKQPAFDLLLEEGKTYNLIIRIKNSYSYKYTFEVFSPNYFATFYFQEYMWFGIFYGMLFFIIIYSFFTYLALRNNLLIAYIVFGICQILFMCFRDGTALYLFRSTTLLVDILENISKCAFVIALVWCCVSFLKLHRYKLLYYSLILFSLTRLILCLTALEGMTFYLFHIDLFMITACLGVSIYCSFRNDYFAKYMVIGLSCLFITYLIDYLSLFDLISMGAFSFFSLYFGVIAESVFFTMASSELIKQMRLDNYAAGQQKIQLENLVVQRTFTISQQNEMLKKNAEEMDHFLYKSSHDIKGPIKTIEGLCTLAQIEGIEMQAVYIQKIKNKSRQLGEIVTEINNIITTKNAELHLELIDFNKIHEDQCANLKNHEGYLKSNVELRIGKKFPFFSDKRLLATIYQNLFENGITYRDNSRIHHLVITIESDKEKCIITFRDNGTGIATQYKDRIFEMFYKANDTISDTSGLGLYTVKLAVEKLQGKINLQTEHGKGSEFIICLPYLNVPI